MINQLLRPAGLDLPVATAPYFHRLILDLSPDDGMYQGNDGHYLSCGASALNVILAAHMLAANNAPRKVLDFGAGAGRVTRWLAAAFPMTNIHACDLREQDMRFLASVFGAHTWLSGTNIDTLRAPGGYDLIWLGSVATHLSAEDVERLLNKMLSWLEPRGLVVMSLHGRYARERQEQLGFTYIHDSAWREIVAGYEASGFGYADYEGQAGYGISLTRLAWTAACVERAPGCTLVMLTEKAWDGHHDVVAIQRA